MDSLEQEIHHYRMRSTAVSHDWSVGRISEMSYETMTRIILFTYNYKWFTYKWFTYKWFRMILDLVGIFNAKCKFQTVKKM